MKKILLIFFVFFLIFSLNLPVFADSPLTSTNFYEAYLDIPEVNNAQGTKMKDWIFDFITDSDTPIDYRVAVINAMGWNINGSNNGDIFIDLMAKKLNKSRSELKIEELKGEELLCLGYLLSLDDYFNLSPARNKGGELETTDALTLVEKAGEIEKDNFTFQLIASLVKAQSLFSKDWQSLYLTVSKVINSDLKRNMRVQAVNIIRNYIDLYKTNYDNKEVKDSALEIEPAKEFTISQGIENLNFTTEGNKIITRNSNNTNVNIFSSENGKLLTPLYCPDFADSCKFSPDGKWILISDWTPQVMIYSSNNYMHIKQFKMDSRVMDIAINPSLSEVAFACFNGNIEIYSISDWKKTKSFEAHRKYVSTLNFSADGTYLLTGSYDSRVKLWNVKKNYSLVYEVKSFKNGTFARFIPGDKEIIARDCNNNIKILNTGTGKVLWEKDLPGTVNDVASDPEGTFIAAATDLGVIYLWNWKKDSEPLIFRAHSAQVLRVCFKGKELYSCGLDNKLKIWNSEELFKKL